VICSESREQLEEQLERWRHALERRGMKISRSKTEYMCMNERGGGGRMRLQGEEMARVEDFKYLGSTVQSNGECGQEVKKRVQAGWNGWRKVSGVLCDRRVSARMKGKVYKTVVRPAMMYGLETVALKRKQEAEMEVAEMKMLRFALGVTRLDKIRNELIRGTAKVRCFGDKVRESRLQWFGHVQRRESEYIGRRMMRMELPGKRARGRPKRRLMDVVREDMMAVGVREEDAGDRLSWKRMTRCGCTSCGFLRLLRKIGLLRQFYTAVIESVQIFNPALVDPAPDTIVHKAKVFGALQWQVERRVAEAGQKTEVPAGCPAGMLFVPQEQRAEVLQWGHSSRIACYPGVNRALFLPSSLVTANLLIAHVFRLHGIPSDMVSDRGPQFVSGVWKAFCKTMGPSVSLSSGYHPQTDQANRDLEMGLSPASLILVLPPPLGGICPQYSRQLCYRLLSGGTLGLFPPLD
ncbi:uncharacterized protein LOC133488234, partial [Phyllopteryx taeniolatus]|uniref:uncharacterized protein LOC133488234 n=1 Tax=Phyllopteryx taeniolatus TaxID=161469 RepID=UPI002AD33E08